MIENTNNLKYISPLTGKPCKTKPSKLLKELERQKTNPQKFYQLQKNWREKHPNYMKEWKANHPGVFPQYYKEYRKNHPEKAKATNASRKSYHPGTGKDFCESCGSKINLEGHHPNYSEPFEIITLCRYCHKYLHSKRRVK